MKCFILILWLNFLACFIFFVILILHDLQFYKVNILVCFYFKCFHSFYLEFFIFIRLLLAFHQLQRYGISIVSLTSDLSPSSCRRWEWVRPASASAAWPWSRTASSASERRWASRTRWSSSTWAIRPTRSAGRSRQTAPSWTRRAKSSRWKVPKLMQSSLLFSDMLLKNVLSRSNH